MMFLRLLRSVLLAAICSHPILLQIVGLVHLIVKGKIEGLFAVLATPMTLAFFGIPSLAGSFFVIVPIYLVLWRLGWRHVAPGVVFAIGVGVFVYQWVVHPEPTGAIPGYDQTAHAFIAASLIVWAIYAWRRPNLHRD